MIIKINDKPLDFTLNNEKTLADVFAAIEQWLSSSGHRLSEISVDGQAVGVSMIEEILKKDVKTIKNLDIRTNSIAELTAASLIALHLDINKYDNLNFEEKAKFLENWKESSQAKFILTEMPDIYSYFENTFSNGDISVSSLRSITEEIQREVNDPLNELIKIEPVLNEICDKLVDLPLDIQTGKDLLAAKTIQVFSAITEKIIRLFRQLSIQGFLLQIEDAKKVALGFSDFKNILVQLLESYEKHDTIIIGDIAEYEASPRLKELYFNILNNCRETAKTQGDE
jgi:hypothetical protein